MSARFANTGNTNSKRGLPLFNREGNSALWSVNADTRITLPQPQQYDDMGGKENAWGGRVLSMMAYMERLSPAGKLQVYERVEVSLVEV